MRTSILQIGALSFLLAFSVGIAPVNAQYASLIGIGTHALRHAARHAAHSSNVGSQNASGPYSSGSGAGDITGAGYYSGQTYAGTSYPANNRRNGGGSYLNGSYGNRGLNDSSSPATNGLSGTANSNGGSGQPHANDSSGSSDTGTIPPFSSNSVSTSAPGYDNQNLTNDRFTAGSAGLTCPPSVNLQTGVYQPNSYPQPQPVSYTPNTFVSGQPAVYATGGSPPPTIYRGRHADRRSIRRINQEVKTHNEAIHLYNKGVELLNADDYKRSIECFEGALRIDPSLDDARHALGIAYNETQDYESALDQCRIAIQQNPSNADFYYTAADAARHLRDFKLSYKYYSRFLSLGGTGDRADEAKKVIDVLDHNYFHQAAGNYLAEATKEGMDRWRNRGHAA